MSTALKRQDLCSHCDKEFVSDKLDFGNWIPDDCVFVLFQIGYSNSRDRH